MVETTQREEHSEVGVARARQWLRWVFPEQRTSALEHGAVIGRDPDCEIRLDGGGVSRRHVEIHRQGPLFALKDLGSTNGTFLNGERIRHAPVQPGAVLRVGEHVGVFVECASEPRDFQRIAAGLFGGHELQVALEPLLRASRSNIPILIVGRTGAGKERVACAVHELSGRTGLSQALNCAALPKELAEAELFGYRKGAFTGAERSSLGYFRSADNGTLFLDEVAELPLALQAKLLRVLEERFVKPLGESQPIPIDVRIVTAAQLALGDLVGAKLFREDLWARLSGLTVTIPGLSERRADIAPLFRHFVHEYSGGRPPGLESKLIEALCVYDWPANVRELEQLARRLLAVHGHQPQLRRSHLSPEFLTRLPTNADSFPAAAESTARREYDLQRLVVALQQNDGSVASAAEALGFSRQRAYRLLAGKRLAELVTEGQPDVAPRIASD